MSEHDDMREILETRKRNVTLTFNLNDQNEREVYEWCNEQADKCSSYIKKILSQYKEYKEFVQTVSKLHEMLPNLQRMFPPESISNLIAKPVQEMSSQLELKVHVPTKPNLEQNVYVPTKSNLNQKVHAPPKPNTEPLPSRSSRHGSKRKRASMPME